MSPLVEGIEALVEGVARVLTGLGSIILLVALVVLLLAGCAQAPPTGGDSLGGDICDEGVCSIFGCPSECSTICNDKGCRPVSEHVQALNDAAPPETRVNVCAGALPSTSLVGNADAGGCRLRDVSSTDPAAPDYLGHDNDDTFRHVYFVSGDAACIGTGTPLGSGRDCGPGGPEQCAYISEGYAVYAVTGGSCGEHGVGLCSGPFCR